MAWKRKAAPSKSRKRKVSWANKSAKKPYGRQSTSGFRKRSSTTSRRGSFKKARFQKKSSVRKHALNSLLATIPNNTLLVNDLNTSTTSSLGQQGFFVGGNDNTTTSVGQCVMHDPVIMENICLAQSALANQRLLITNWETQHTIKNLNVSECEVTEYRCVCRHDIVDQIGVGGVSFTNLQQYFGQLSPTPTIAPAAPYNNAIHSSDVGFTPFMAPIFVANFRIKKVKKFNLTGGASKYIKYTWKKPMVRDRMRFNPGAASLANLRIVALKGTSFSLFVFKGGIVAGTASGYSTADTGLGIATILRVDYKFITTNAAYAAFKAGIPATVGGSTIALPEMNPVYLFGYGTGALQTSDVIDTQL